MTDEPRTFPDYLKAVDDALMYQCFVTTADAGIEREEIVRAHEGGWTPEEFVCWFIEKYDLITRTSCETMIRLADRKDDLTWLLKKARDEMQSGDSDVGITLIESAILQLDDLVKDA